MTEPPSPLRMLLSRHTKRREFITLLVSWWRGRSRRAVSYQARWPTPAASFAASAAERNSPTGAGLQYPWHQHEMRRRGCAQK
jgi:hypothetical protein